MELPPNIDFESGVGDRPAHCLCVDVLVIADLAYLLSSCFDCSW